MITPATSLSDAAKAVCVSMDSTLRSNLSVGMPLDLTIIERDALAFGLRRRIESNDAEFNTISQHWGHVLKAGFDSLPSMVD